MNFLGKGILLGAFALITACSASVPECSDSETIDLVKQITNDEMASQVGAESATLFEYGVSAIRTTNVNETTGARDCAAELEISGPNGMGYSGQITYTVEITDDGEEFYVTVYGL